MWSLAKIKWSINYHFIVCPPLITLQPVPFSPDITMVCLVVLSLSIVFTSACYEKVECNMDHINANRLLPTEQYSASFVNTETRPSPSFFLSSHNSKATLEMAWASPAICGVMKRNLSRNSGKSPSSRITKNEAKSDADWIHDGKTGKPDEEEYAWKYYTVIQEKKLMLVKKKLRRIDIKGLCWQEDEFW